MKKMSGFLLGTGTLILVSAVRVEEANGIARSGVSILRGSLESPAISGTGIDGDTLSNQTPTPTSSPVAEVSSFAPSHTTSSSPSYVTTSDSLIHIEGIPTMEEIENRSLVPGTEDATGGMLSGRLNGTPRDRSRKRQLQLFVSDSPSASPSHIPSASPSHSPSSAPSATPTRTVVPSSDSASVQPNVMPSAMPSDRPSGPSYMPSRAPISTISSSPSNPDYEVCGSFFQTLVLVTRLSGPEKESLEEILERALEDFASQFVNHIPDATTVATILSAIQSAAQSNTIAEVQLTFEYNLCFVIPTTGNQDTDITTTQDTRSLDTLPSQFSSGLGTEASRSSFENQLIDAGAEVKPGSLSVAVRVVVHEDGVETSLFIKKLAIIAGAAAACMCLAVVLGCLAYRQGKLYAALKAVQAPPVDTVTASAPCPTTSSHIDEDFRIQPCLHARIQAPREVSVSEDVFCEPILEANAIPVSCVRIQEPISSTNLPYKVQGEEVLGEETIYNVPPGDDEFNLTYKMQGESVCEERDPPARHAGSSSVSAERRSSQCHQLAASRNSTQRSRRRRLDEV